MKTKTTRKTGNEDGLATIEALPLLVIFLVLITYGLGLFGVVHTGILNSIAARAYAFETFRYRTNLTYFRENGSGESVSGSRTYRKYGMRFHGVSVNQSGSGPPEFIAVERPIVFGRPQGWAPTGATSSKQDHNEKIFNITRKRNRSVAISPAWVNVVYGICLDAGCGDN